jgi:hypothetical protein
MRVFLCPFDFEKRIIKDENETVRDLKVMGCGESSFNSSSEKLKKKRKWQENSSRLPKKAYT